jgi:tetratricopeptide (TPR) repeat protein
LAHGHLDVRTGIALSYAGLAPEVRTLLRRLGDLDLPEISVWMAAALMDADTITGEELLEELFDAQLLDFVGTEATGQPRYRLHDLVRLFAKERAELDEPAQAREAARERAVGAWLCLADAIYHNLFGGPFQNVVGDAPRWAIDDRLVQLLIADPLRWFETERHAIVAMVRRAGAEGRVTACWELTSLTSELFQMRRYHDDWQQILGAALAATRWAGDRRGEACILYRMGHASGDRRRSQEAWNQFQDSAHLFEEVSDAHGLAIARFSMAMVERMRGDDVTALARYEQALPVLREHGDLGGAAFVIRSIGQIHLERGGYAAAEECFEQALDLGRRIGWRHGMPTVLAWRGTLRLRQERYQEAEADVRQALALVRGLGDRTGEGACLHLLGQCAARRGDREGARTILQEALQVMRQPTPTVIELRIREALTELDAAS